MIYEKITISLAFIIIYTTGCKNDRTDETRIDSTTLLAPMLSPVPGKIKPDSNSTMVTKPDSILPEKKNIVSPEKKNRAEEEVGVKKVSRKGRIILQLLKNAGEEKIESDKEGIYNRAEIMPVFPGGETALRKFIENTIQYPDMAIDNTIQGTVKLYFAVDEQGNVYTPIIISPILGYGIEEEALRVIRKMPKWIPGQIKGQNVKTHFTLPITFQID